MKGMPKDETIIKWLSAYNSKSEFQSEMVRRLEIVEKEYNFKKLKIQYIIKKLKDL